MAGFLGELDCAAFVLDCTPNMTPQQIEERLHPFVIHLRDLRPDAAFIIVDNPPYQDIWFSEESRKKCTERSQVLRECFSRLNQHADLKRLSLVSMRDWAHPDGESTVANHSTDLGFMRYAEWVYPELQGLKNED